MVVVFPAPGKNFPDFKMLNSSEQDKGGAANLSPVSINLNET